MNAQDANQPPLPSAAPAPEETPPAEPNASMQEYYRLQKDLLITTLAMVGVAFIGVWVFYSFNNALNYLLGACTGVVYLRMLGRSVEQLGREKKRLGSTRLALFVGLIIVATQLNQLKIVPIFLGFLTYKAAIIVYVLRTSFLPDSR